MTAVAPDAYPGAGVVTAVVMGDVPYAASLGRGIGPLVVALGWLDAPPTPAELLEALSATDFDGMLAADGPEPLQVESGDDLTLAGSVRRPFDEGPWRLHLLVRADGTARIALAPMTAPLAAPTPIDAITASVRELDGTDVAALTALRALAGSRDPRAITALVRATARPTEAVWVAALSALAPTLPQLAASLAAAWSPLAADQIAARLAVAEELHGAALAGSIRGALP